MTSAYILDSWALMAFLQKEQPAAMRVRQLMADAKSGATRLYMSLINLGEVYYRLGRIHGQREADDMLERLRRFPLDILPADEETVLVAARWKMKYPISYADAFAAAATEEHQAILLTGDPELIGLKGWLKIEALKRQP